MKNILLYLSAFMPMYFLVLVKEVVALLTNNIKFDILAVIVLIFIIAVIGLGVVGLYLQIFKHKQSERTVKLISKKNITDEHFLGYFSLFVLYAISFDLSKPCMFVIFILIMIMIGIVYIKNKLFYINPLLNILGYNFYDIQYKIVGEENEESTKIFYKGNLINNKNFILKIKDENFSFLVDNN